MRQVLFVATIAVVLVAGLGVRNLGGVADRQTVTTTTTLTCPKSSPNVLGGGGGAGPAPTDFLVTISFQGQWSAVVTTYSAFQMNATYLHLTCDYAGNSTAPHTPSTALIYFSPWNPNGEQTVKVTAYKLEPGNGNLTVSVGYANYSNVRSNSTITPFGNATAFLSTAP